MRLHLLFKRRRKREEELDEEIHAHLAMAVRERIEQGEDPAEAELNAHREFGNVPLVKDVTRDIWGWCWLETLLQDVRYGLRQLRRNPGFTVVAILTLALGIGANTAIFSVVNRVLLEPLPYPQPERLVDLSFSAPKIHMRHLGMSASMYFVYGQQSRTFQDIALYSDRMVNVSGAAEPERLRALDVTYGLLPILGVRPILGRQFNQSDDSFNSPDAVMLTYGYWQKAFGGDRSVVGKTIDVEGTPREIIGVLPRQFSFLDEPTPALILPIKLDYAKTSLGNFGYGGIARLKPGVTLTQADADVARMLPIVARSFPPPPRFTLKMYESSKIEPHLQPLKQEVVGGVGQVLWILMGGIGLVLLIACANVANLLLARAEGRRQELAVRASLGASPGRIVRQALTESFTLSLPGGALGLVFAFGALKVLVGMAPSTLPRLNEIQLDGTVLEFTVGICFLASVLFALIPVLKYFKPGLGIGLRQAERVMSVSREKHRAQRTLVVVQVGLAVVLLISSGLMIRTFRALMHTQPGFVAPPSDVQTFHLSIPEADARQPDQVIHFEQAMLQKIGAIPGVSSAGISTSVPMDGGLGFEPLFVKGHSAASGGLPPVRYYNFVSPGFFRTIGTPLVAGRGLTWNDIFDRLPVVAISANLARQYWRNPADAIGKQVRMGASDQWHEIVGVVGDIHDNGLNKPSPPEVHWPLITSSFQGVPIIAPRSIDFVIRSRRAGSASFMKEVQREVWSVDPSVPLADLHTLDYYYGKSMARTSFTLVMLAIAGTMALLLGTIGLYGVISYSVSRRTHEIGVRMALGAEKGDVLRMVVSQGLKLALIGVAIGVGGALALTRFLANQLHGVKATDPLTFIAVSLILIAVALAACYIPARRAARVDPMEALRYE